MECAGGVETWSRIVISQVGLDWDLNWSAFCRILAYHLGSPHALLLIILRLHKNMGSWAIDTWDMRFLLALLIYSIARQRT